MTNKKKESVVEKVIAPTQKEKEKKIRAVMVSETNLLIDDCAYRLTTNYREAFDVTLLSDRYSDVLNRYEYIVGDVGFEQLRLKGFFSDDHQNMPAENRIGNLEDYLYEYCNFGCPYFVLERIGEHPVKENKNRQRRSQNKSQKAGQKKQAHVNEKRQSKEKDGKEKKISNRQRPVVKKREENKKEVNKKGINKKEDSQSTVNQAEKHDKTTKRRGFTIRQKNN